MTADPVAMAGEATDLRPDRRVTAVAVAIGVLLLLSVAGVATHDPDGRDAGQSTVAAAARSTHRTGTAGFDVTYAMRGSGMAVELTGTGVVDFAGDRAAVTLAPPGGAAADMVVVGDTVYLRDPNRGPLAPGTPPWTARRTAPMTGLFSSGPDTGGDPLGTLRLLADEGALDAVRHDGVDEVGGVRVARYSGALDLDAVRRRLAAAAPELGPIASAVRPADTSLVVWVSDDGLVRRVQTVVVLAAGEVRMETTMTLTLRDFGAPVRIEVPPPDQVQRPAG